MPLHHEPDPTRLNNDLEPLLSGTLVLMTALQNPGACVHIPTRIVSNLERLAAHPRLSAEFRMVLERLRLHWQARCSPEPAPQPCGASRTDQRILH